MTNIVKVNRGYSAKDFKVGQFVVNIERPTNAGDEQIVYCVSESRSDGFMRVTRVEPPFESDTMRAEECEPFYGTIIIESKP